MTPQRKALESARDWIAEERRIYLEADETADVDAADLALAQIDAALAEPDQSAEIARLRALFRVNALRWVPGVTHAEIDALLDGRDHIPEAGKKVFTGTLRWENNVLYAGKLKVGSTWSSAAGQRGYFGLTGSGVGSSRANIATEAESRAALEDAVLALGDSHGDPKAVGVV